MSSLDFLSSMLTNTFRPPGRRSPPLSSHSGKPDKDITIVAGVLCSMELAGGREGVSRQLVQHSQQPSVSGRARRVDPKNIVKPTLVVYPTRIVQVLRVFGARHGVRSGGLEDCSGRRGHQARYHPSTRLDCRLLLAVSPSSSPTAAASRQSSCIKLKPKNRRS